jgi:hypothetical protein
MSPNSLYVLRYDVFLLHRCLTILGYIPGKKSEGGKARDTLML